MKITGQDLVSPSCPASSVRLPAAPVRSWARPIVRSAAGIIAILIVVLAAFIAGMLAQANDWTVARDPRFQIASSWQRARLPTLYLDVEFKDAQRLKADYQGAQATGVNLAASDVITEATVHLDGDNIPAQIRLPLGEYASGEWAFEITTIGTADRGAANRDKRGLFGWHHVLLYSAMTRRMLSQWGLSESLQREGILSAPIRSVELEFNGDALGVYGVWPAPEEMLAQSRALDSLVYFDQTPYWQDLRRQLRGGPTPTSINLSDCQVAAIASVGQADQAAMSLLRDLQVGQRAASDVLDTDQMGTLLALTALWQGAPLDRVGWTRLAFYLDAATGRLRPAAMANLISPSNQDTLGWPVCFDDPALQMAFTRAVERISQPEYLDKLRADLGSTFDQMQLTFAGDGAFRAELTWDDMDAGQKSLAPWLEPTQIVLASWRGSVPLTASLTPSSTLAVSLSNLQYVPVEVLGLDVGKSTFLPINPAWIQDGADLVVSSSKGSVVLRAAGDGRLRALRLDVPYTAVFAASRAYDEPVEIRLVTRLWGLARRQSVLMQQVSGE